MNFFFCTGDFLTIERFIGFCSSFELHCKQKVHLLQLFFSNYDNLVTEPYVERVIGVELDSKLSTVSFSGHRFELYKFLCSCTINVSIAATSYRLFSCATPYSRVISLLEPYVEFVSGFVRNSKNLQLFLLRMFAGNFLSHFF